MNCKVCNKDIRDKHKGAKFCSLQCVGVFQKINPEDVFHERYKITDSGCWEWTGNRCINGYGRLNDKKMHRFSWEYYNGKKVPDGLYICHKCDNPPCVNPEHLYAGTAADNIRDAKERGRLNPARGEKQPNAKLTNSDARKIYVDDRADEIIAAEFGVSRKCVSRVKTGKSWSYVTKDLTPLKRINLYSDEWHTKKLRSKDVLEIIKSRKTIKFLSEKYNVRPCTITRILNGKTWSSVTGIKNADS